MTNAELFKITFGIYSEEFWSYTEKQMLDWINADVPDTNVGDTISRRAAIERINKQREHLEPNIFPQDKIGDAAYQICAEFIESMPSVQPEQQWIPVKTRPMDEEERKYYIEELGWSLDDDEAVMFDSLMPDDGQEVWVCSKCGNVWQDTCVIDEGIGLDGYGDWLDIVAWMPYKRPKPWKGDAE